MATATELLKLTRGVIDYKDALILRKGTQLELFIKAYLHAYGDGTIKRLAKKFRISDGTVQRVRTRLKLPTLFAKEHPGRKAVYSRIRTLYFDGMGTEMIANKLSGASNRSIKGMCSQRVNQILKQMHIQIMPQHVTNCKYFSTRQTKFSKEELLDEIVRLYKEEKMTLKAIAKKLGIWEGTVSSKLKAMGYPIMRHRNVNTLSVKPNHNIIEIYKDKQEPYRIYDMTNIEYTADHITAKGEGRVCLWCGQPYKAYISVGIRSQIFCTPKCRNKAKDLRRGLKPRMIKGKVRLYTLHFENLVKEFKGDINKLKLSLDVYTKVKEVKQYGQLQDRDEEVKQRLQAVDRERTIPKVDLSI